MARKSVAAAAQKWQQRTSQSQQYYQQGVQNTTKSWSANAEAAAPRRDAALQAAMASGRIDAGIRRAGDQKWKANTLAKGVQNWATGVANGGNAYQQGLQRAYGFMDSGDAAIGSMPTTTREDRIQRAAAWQRAVGDAADAWKNQNG